MRAGPLHIRTLKSLLLAGAGACLLAAGAAQAQEATPPVDDGLEERALYLDAAEVARIGDRLEASREQGDRLYARFQDHALRTRRLTYDLATGIATADGEVELTAPDGSTVFADYLELTDGAQTGVAVNFATRLEDGSSLMAATAVRRSETVNELNYAIFTPCPICDEDGPKEPTVSIQAQRVIQDENLRAVLYRNAVFKVKGVPVLYLPFFAHPDPTVERASGFLVPEIGFDQERGLSWEQPYLIVVSPSEDWLISPQFNSEVEPLLNLQWRRRFADGTVVARGGYTYARNFGDFDADDDGVDDVPQPLDREHRSYLLAHGTFDPTGPWRWGFTAERTSDKTLFDRYDVRDPYADNGLYHGDERRLISQVYAERQTKRSYLSFGAFAIQSLRVVQFNDTAPGLNVFESDGALPVAAPIVEGRWEPDGPVFGGRLRLTGSAVALYREEFAGAPVLRPEVLPVGPAPTQGVDGRRVTGRAEWRRTMISPAGVRWAPFVDGRVDLYSISDLPAPGLEAEQTVTRGRFTAGLDVSWPLIRPLSGGADLVLEPMGQISASTDADLDPRVPNEDSQVLDLDETSLFRIDRFPGLDLYEGGLRLTGGARATLRWDEGREASLFVGRSWRSDAEPGLLTASADMPSVLYDATGLADETSDWVVQGTFEPHDGVRAWGRATIDGSGEVRRAEAAVEGRWGRRNAGSLIYVMDDSNPVEGPLNRNYAFVESSVQQFIVDDWGVVGRGVYDLDRDLFVRSEVGLLFDDDCVRFEIGYRRDNTRVRPSGASEGAYVRLTLATFGGTR
ncbi:LPS-assembly protein LptD [Brevundimonas fluminis]|jgi:LPS-assembly protein|uniref:LPS-assembly protein LptD n=1 Tax=Brevundimonas fluminis TaxID=2487274 RepID=UPI000F65856B|nr:LPS assembly protein LptD [Brevundimonas fluminis]